MDIIEVLSHESSFKQFSELHWGKKLLKGKSSFIQNIMNKEKFLEQLGRSVIPAKNVVVNHVSGINFNKKISPVIIGSKLSDLIVKGESTLIFSNFKSYFQFPQFQEFGTKLEQASRTLVRSNLYHTINSKRGYPFHWDNHNLVVFQLSGKKKWQIYEPLIKNPIPFINLDNIPSLKKSEFKLIEEIILEEGDFLFLPKGFGHSVTTLTDSSMHVTFGFHDVSMHDLFKVTSKTVMNSMKNVTSFRQFLSASHVEETLLESFREIFFQALNENYLHFNQRNYSGIGLSHKSQPFHRQEPYSAYLKNANCYFIEDEPLKKFHLFIGNPTQEGMNSAEFPMIELEGFQKLFTTGLLGHMDIVMQGIELNSLYMLESFGVIELKND